MRERRRRSDVTQDAAVVRGTDRPAVEPPPAPRALRALEPAGSAGDKGSSSDQLSLVCTFAISHCRISAKLISDCKLIRNRDAAGRALPLLRYIAAKRPRPRTKRRTHRRAYHPSARALVPLRAPAGASSSSPPVAPPPTAPPTSARAVYYDAALSMYESISVPRPRTHARAAAAAAARHDRARAHGRGRALVAPRTCTPRPVPRPPRAAAAAVLDTRALERRAKERPRAARAAAARRRAGGARRRRRRARCRGRPRAPGRRGCAGGTWLGGLGSDWRAIGTTADPVERPERSYVPAESTSSHIENSSLSSLSRMSWPRFETVIGEPAAAAETLPPSRLRIEPPPPALLADCARRAALPVAVPPRAAPRGRPRPGLAGRRGRRAGRAAAGLAAAPLPLFLGLLSLCFLIMSSRLRFIDSSAIFATAGWGAAKS